MSHNGYRKDLETNTDIINKPMLEINEVVGSLGVVGSPVFSLAKMFFCRHPDQQGEL